MASFALDLIKSGRKDSNLRPSAPKAPATQKATAPMRNKWGYILLVSMTGINMSLNIASYCCKVSIGIQKLAQISHTNNLVFYEH